MGYATRETQDEEKGKRYVKNSVKFASIHGEERLQINSRAEKVVITKQCGKPVADKRPPSLSATNFREFRLTRQRERETFRPDSIPATSPQRLREVVEGA
jgi:aspartate oxidase